MSQYFFARLQKGYHQEKAWNNHLKIGLTGAVTHKENLPNAYPIFQDINESFFIKLAHYPNELTHEDFTHLLSMPNSTRIPLLKQLMNGRGKFFVDLAEWELFTSKLDFVVGSRMHGAIVSLNAGVPAVVTSGDSRAREMCELFCIPLFAGRDDIKTIYEEADFTQFNQSYKKLYTQFMDFLSQNIGHRPVPLSEEVWHNRIIKSISKQLNIDPLRH